MKGTLKIFSIMVVLMMSGMSCWIWGDEERRDNGSYCDEDACYYCENGVCSEVECFYDSDCRRGEICTDSGLCIYEAESSTREEPAEEPAVEPEEPAAPEEEKIVYPNCEADTDCKAGEICEEGTCVDDQLCATDGECPDGICVNSRCFEGSARCATGKDCDSGQICLNAICSSSCAVDADCGDFTTCRNSICFPMCANDIDCYPGDVCVDGRCQAPAK